MCDILIVDGDGIERHVIKEILTSSFQGISNVFQARNNEEAISVVHQNHVDLMIFNMPYSIMPLTRLVGFLRAQNPKTAMLLTTAKSEKEASLAVMKLKADGYLLKPYKPEALLSAANQYVLNAQKSNGDEWEREQKNLALERMEEGLQQHRFKLCVDAAKDYINAVYDHSANGNALCGKMMEFVIDVVDIVSLFRPALREPLLDYVGKIRYDFHRYTHRYNVFVLFENLMRDVFVAMDQSYEYMDDIKKVINYIDCNIRRGITLDKAAAMVNMSSCYFSKMFKKEAEENFITYVTNQRIELAKEMLEYTEMPVINIAYDLSYNETSYFSKDFKKRVGVTPTEFRSGRKRA